MVKRWRQEWINHGRNFGNCHCGNGMGTMRKHRPNESHPSSSCGLCAYERSLSRLERRKERYAARLIIRDELIRDTQIDLGPIYGTARINRNTDTGSWYQTNTPLVPPNQMKDLRRQAFRVILSPATACQQVKGDC